ncbi:DNA-directed RNA polymerase sigma-70 factor [Planobispora rosea]|uniref:DNA-directed RNA polymerase sigma-70 factor n=1 Tax=Planobispora rosea TaxID=35762 RepID=A0A8J3S804_PLARO|nr:RNA polymerase sigma factor SigJ [Planobispora rosea]GGS97204.1 DNA-directed RNA polymerase sigma-70 factor [Planobispora rosea]GIH87702.1 DNA-directed RNA polymerase sigma-70 factor [Planobispora rosea]
MDLQGTGAGERPRTPVDVFEEQRPRLFGLAYRLLGSAAEAEDLVQETFLRWSRAGRIEVPAAWLTKVITNLCLNQLASARRRRESYAGPWLPEPVLTGDGVLGPLETVEQRESVSLGLLVLLERLSPAERAVFVLREAFGHSHAEIGDVLGVDEAYSRQLHRRARAHVGEARKRFGADREQHRRIVEGFLAATLRGDVAGLERLLAADVVAWADGGGTTAARRPVRGRERVLRYLRGLSARPEASAVTAAVAEVNGEFAVLLRHTGELRAVMAVEIGDGRISAVRTLVNPAKLAFAAAQLM